MGKSKFFTLLILCLLINKTSFSQIIFKELPKYEFNSSDSLFFDISPTRSVITLNGTWKVYAADDEDKNKVTIQVPSYFKGNGELIFEKSFPIDERTLINNKIRIYFLGLNYSADISVNKSILYRHTGGEYPFYIDIPKDIINTKKNNLLSIKLNYKLDSENTIPLKQRFLLPQNFGGMLRDVFIHLEPNISISESYINYSFNNGRARVSFNTKISNKDFRKNVDSTEENVYTLKATFYNPEIESYSEHNLASFSIPINKEKDVNASIDINAFGWTPQVPSTYVVNLELWKKDILVDRSKKALSFLSLTTSNDEFRLNGNSFQLSGVTYAAQVKDNGPLLTYEQMDRDIKLIKETGFNSVRFIGNLPHPYLLRLCEKYGLLAFIELPIYSAPEDLTDEQNFKDRTKNYLSSFLKFYKNYSAVAAIGLGGGYLSNSQLHLNYLSEFGSFIKKHSHFLTYASFASLSNVNIDNIDLVGLELFNKNIKDYQEDFTKLEEFFGKNRIFISASTYTVSGGSSNGYSNPYSYEAQAKYFKDLIEYADSSSIPGYFINSMFDYRGDYASLTAGFNTENVYTIGIVNEERNAGSRLSYKVISAKLHNTEDITIPVGSKRDNAPMIFIVFGIFLAILLGVLVNSGRKFREDSSRALLRPYNFYADVRDQRIMSGYHTTLLAIVVSAISALLISNLLFYLKEKPSFERILLSFGSPNLIKYISYLAWNPVQSLFYLTIVTLVVLIIITIIVKIGSLFVRNRVFISSSYYIVIWAMLPLVLLIPLGIILFRVLTAEAANMYILIGLILFTLWIIYRLLKGIYVIYDVNASSVYFYASLLLFLFVGGLLFYYQINNDLFDYLSLAFKQYNIFS
ncbi:MAG TPA: glycoside hydrolase family 2 TIM barrel-domain containing protein [Ignavibacteriaceae bacterium]|nr:glycoside hydrolase family 2 TIM barrel-domain containing protein [Ignavibacteriaceae bacterium]